MTQETKLGLLIGGAFILCFSLILSTAQDGVLADRELTAIGLAHPGGQPTQRSDIGRLPLEDYLQEQGHRGQVPAPRNRRTLAHGSASADPVRDRAALTTDPPLGQTAIAQTAPLPSRAPRQRPLLPPSPPRSTDADAPDPSPETAEPPAGSNRGMLEDVTQLVAGRAGQPPSPQPQRVQIYEVAKGDTLTRIAQRFYGHAAPEDIQRIWEANRQRVPSQDALRAGQRLEIPTIDQPDAGPRPVPAARPTPARPQATFQFYQIRDNDRYATIARDQLGSAARWREIYELNRERFPDANRIRPGVRIRLPLQ